MRQKSKLMKLPEQAVDNYLGGRPRDPRVTYATAIPKGKAYYRTPEKAAALLAEMAAKEAAAAAKVQVVDPVDNSKPALKEFA